MPYCETEVVFSADAVEAARDADHVFVAAAGNGNIIGWGQDNDSTPFWPSNFDLDNVIAVAAVDHNDSKPLFSNYGATTVDLAAPGVNILSTVPNNGYGLNTGTSMASPHVAGVIGLVRDLHPDWDYAEAIHQVLQSALGGDRHRRCRSIHGPVELIQVGQAVNKLLDERQQGSGAD